MTTPLLVTNLPPGISIEEIKSAFTPYGCIHHIMQCTDYYRNLHYSLNAAYVCFEEKRSIDFFLEDYVDVVINGFFTDIKSIHDSPLAQSTAVIYGMSEGITKSDLFYALQLDTHAEISIQRPGSPKNDGYGFIIFPDPQFCNSFLMNITEVSINNCQMAIHRYPQPTIPPREPHSHIISCSGSKFLKLKNIEKFQDFTIHTPNKTYLLSSKILSGSSAVIAKQVSAYPFNFEFTLTAEGNYDEVFDSLYGAPLQITDENCMFILEVASKLEIPDLIAAAGSVCYESLTFENVLETLQSLESKHINYNYIVDFFVFHHSEIRQSKSDILVNLNPTVLRKIAKHPNIQSMPFIDVSLFFQNVLIVGKLKESEISHVDNAQLEIDSNRQLLIDYLSSKKSKIKNKQNTSQQEQAEETNRNQFPS